MFERICTCVCGFAAVLCSSTALFLLAAKVLCHLNSALVVLILNLNLHSRSKNASQAINSN